MTDEDDRPSEGAIHKVDTVPPPAGEGDAYNAPTKVGPVTSEAWVELMRKADEEGKRAAEADEAARSSRRPAPDADADEPASSRRQPRTADELEGPPSVPRVYADEDLEESNAATLLHPLSKRLHDPSGRADADILGTAAPAGATPGDEVAGPISSPLGVPGSARPLGGGRLVALGVGMLLLVVALWLSLR